MHDTFIRRARFGVVAAAAFCMLGLGLQAEPDAASSAEVSYAVGGLPPSRALRLVVWNRGGDGQTAEGGTVVSDAEGAATATVPLHSVFALTTVGS